MKNLLLFLLAGIIISIALLLLIPSLNTTQKPIPAVTSVELVESIPAVPLENQLGQLFMIGHWADTPVASTTELIAKYQLGGVIIMSTPENSADILTWVNEWNAVSDRPLLIAIDQEGGPVTRLKGAEFIQTGQRDITSQEQAYEVGFTRGTELLKLGINMNFAPVLDTALNPSSFMYSRTFPADTDTAALAGALASGMSEAGVMATVKHFPGHDDTSTDSHNELPVVDIPRSELETFVAPFKKFITVNPPPALMTAHVQFPEIDNMPATLSKFFLTDYLRGELGYTGLIVTDDMSMDAIDTYYETSIASRLAIEAGADVVLLAAQPADINTIFPFLVAQASTSPELRTQIAESYTRIMSIK